VPDSAAFIIDMAGAKLRSELASADSMLVFAVWRRSAIDDAQSASVSHRQKGTRLRSGRRGEPILLLLLLQHLRRFGLASYTHRATRAGALHRCSIIRQDQTRFWLHTPFTVQKNIEVAPAFSVEKQRTKPTRSAGQFGDSPS
jgi:hypothetical protein